MRRLLREPLLHFLLLGVILFAAGGLLREPAAPDEQVIRVTAADLDRLRTLWERQHRRPPLPEELQGLVAAHLQEEVLYREALAMGLDQNDTIVRRRLVQKLEFLIEDVAVARAPGDDELEVFFAAHEEAYRSPPRVSFSHVYFSGDRRGGAAAEDAHRILADLGHEMPAADAAARGDGFMPGEVFGSQRFEDVAAIFGPGFAQELLEQNPGGWIGPIASAYGWHLVRIEDRRGGALPRLDEVIDRVREDWRQEERRRANEAVVARLAARYTVLVEGEALDRPIEVSLLEAARR